MKKILLTLMILLASLNAFDNPDAVERTGWYFNDKNTSTSSDPSTLKYFKFYDILPDEISIKAFENQDLSQLTGKKLYVGYSTVDPYGKDCKTFYAVDTGFSQDVKVCLPWWRIEREYIKDTAIFNNSTPSYITQLRKQKPPLMINVCKTREDAPIYEGGKVTCTTYYDKTAEEGCADNPTQDKCYVNNCGKYLEERCDFVGVVKGEVESLDTAVITEENSQLISQEQTRVNLSTIQYNCPSGSINTGSCLEEENVLMFPYECIPDAPETQEDESEYIYCDKDKPIYSEGSITGFDGKCSSGESVICEVNKFSKSEVICKEPIYETNDLSEMLGTELVRTFTDVEDDFMSGNTDQYSENPLCLRTNTVKEGREDKEWFVNIVGVGTLDDDIYIIKHKEDGAIEKIYCNMQHSRNNGSKKDYNGETLQCSENDGSYAFNSEVAIGSTDIITVQQNSENEDGSPEPFSIGRRHYNSTVVKIDNVVVAPEVTTSQYPFYPRHDGNVKTWDNTTATYSILFPFAGSYKIYFFNKNGKEMGVTTIGTNDFLEMGDYSNKAILLGKGMELAPGISDDTSTVLNANREDPWVEWGGGVFGGKHSITGVASSVPLDSYVKENAVTQVVVKDLLTGAVVQLPMVYPLPYPNRIFISKLRVKEHRKYRCYNSFPAPNLIPDSKTSYVCSENPEWVKFKNGVTTTTENVDLWNDNSTCEQNCRGYVECDGSGENFTCTASGATDIGGDVSGNLFSNKGTCDGNCFSQNSCESYEQNDCEIVEDQLSSPVTDTTGKTVFRKKSISYRCDTSEKKQIGCAKYEINKTEGSVDYNLDAVGWETKDFSADFETAVAMANMIEVGSMHIWSGWQGKCVEGKKWNFEYLSDPMTIASYAMSAYSAYSSMGSGAKEAAKTAELTSAQGEWTTTFAAEQSTVVNNASAELAGETAAFANTGSEAISSSIGDARAIGSVGTNSISGQINNLEKSFFDNISDKIASPFKTANENMSEYVGDAKKLLLDETGIVWDAPVESLSGWGVGKTITQGDLVQFGVESAMATLPPTIDQYALADKMLGSYYGQNDDETELQAYNSCMASIGASMPNLIAWSGGSKDGLTEMVRPWEHPLRMTPDQLASIAVVTSEEYVISNYVYETNDNLLFDVRAINAPSYMKAARTICMGTKVAQAAEHLESKRTNDEAQSAPGANIALGVAKAAVGVVCPPCGFALTVVMDLATNVLASINTCDDELDAMQWDLLHFKTNKFMKHEQCVPKKEYCDQDTKWMGCVRTGYDYCCYDQITTRIFAEGLKDQMFEVGDPKKWQKCNDITVNDLKDISFRECESGESPFEDKCFSVEKNSEFKQALFRQATKGIDLTGLQDQVINSMALDTE